ncbi:hypothetical protein FRACA_30026 [Frankia canadensis]|uniref:Uncharacterized protein n=1 Tax=Frankia canadensis TaxID=1836972 RepID=A0A2I2KTM8_9ACTN|nr:hypothetical protein FRACA_30026 [Frankia canadensis]SOU56313.1 hypothetical protein FRACA_30026 [Frankia canadensis]
MMRGVVWGAGCSPARGESGRAMPGRVRRSPSWVSVRRSGSVGAGWSYGARMRDLAVRYRTTGDLSVADNGGYGASLFPVKVVHAGRHLGHTFQECDGPWPDAAPCVRPREAGGLPWRLDVGRSVRAEGPFRAPCCCSA